MSKRKTLRDKVPLMTVISFVSVILGAGFIFWGIYSIGRPTDYTITNTIDTRMEKVVESIVKESAVVEEMVSTQAKVLYPDYPVEGDQIGSLTIPALNLELPVFQGTGREELKKGVGHFIQSVLPGEADNTVLSGHRETVFRELGDLVIGDQLIVETTAGIFTYEVSGTRIVDKDDKTVIVPTEHAVLTMSTCYPFRYIGPAPERYIVSADLIINK